MRRHERICVDLLEGRRLFAAPPVGDGLLGTYYDDQAFKQKVVARVDPTVQFNWGLGAPAGAEGVGDNSFSVRWTGKVRSATKGTYTFYVKGDDGARLWVNGKQLVDDWTTRSSVRERSGRISLDANQWYDIRVEYFEGGGAAAFSLAWQGPGIAKQIIPTASLFSGVSSPTPTPTPVPTPTPTPVPTPTPTWPPPVSSYALLDAATARVVPGYETITDGAVIDLDTLASTPFVNLGAAVAPGAAAVGSVVFVLDGVVVTENAAPYAVLGEAADGGLRRWMPGLGTHTLTASFYAGPDGTGAAGPARTITFTVTDPTPEADPYPDGPQPAPGGTRYLVDPRGPVRTIADAAALARPGDVVLVAPGVYPESVKLPRGGTAARRITYAAAVPGTVTVDGTGFTSIFDAAVDYVSLEGLTFQHASNALQQPAVAVGSYARVTDCVVQDTDSQGMIVYGTGAVLTRVVAQRNGEEGITGVTCSDVLLKDCVTRYNNNGKAAPVWAGGAHAILGGDGLWYVDGTWQAGGGKWVLTDRVTLDGLRSYGNHGPGIWFDYNNTNVVIRNCTSSGNLPITPARFYEALGINIELCPGPVLIENCTVGPHDGATLLVQSSRQVTVRGNTFEGGSLGLQDWPRGGAYTLRDVTITGNRFVDAFVWADGGTWSTSAGRYKRLTIDGNRYEDDGASPLFRLVSVNYQKLSDLQLRLGFERNGKHAVVVPPPGRSPAVVNS